MERVLHPHARHRRARAANWVLGFAILWLVGSFFRVQVVEAARWKLQSGKNQLRPVVIPAPRGTIYDRHGRVVAENVPGYSISVLPMTEDSIRVTLTRLAPLINLTPEAQDRVIRDWRMWPNQPALVTGDATFEEVSRLEERRRDFPTVLIDMYPKREYPAGESVAHLVGYVSEISRDELARSEYTGYVAGQLIGKSGIERQYEKRLAGRPGIRYVEVDYKGRIVRLMGDEGTIPPIPGEDLQLNLDLDLQEYIHRVFEHTVPLIYRQGGNVSPLDSVRGAVVAMIPSTGEVLALYSHPTFDPNAFTGGVSTEYFSSLLGSSSKPLINRAINGTYPPASTFKLAAAVIGLETGTITPETTFPIPCTGGMPYGGRIFRCWDHRGHGFLDLVGAIKHSCDVYFYQLGLAVTLDRFVKEGTRLGFGRRVGIDLPSELAGHFPADKDYWLRNLKFAANESETLNLAIGQGPDDQTPLKMAWYFSALAGDGTVRAPRVARIPGDNPPVTNLNITPAHLEVLREGMRQVAQPGGTAVFAEIADFELSGKTGSAQRPPLRDFGWFVGMGGEPNRPPEIVVAVLIEEGQHGSTVAPIAGKIIDYWLRARRGLPIDTIQTVQDASMAGMYAKVNLIQSQYIARVKGPVTRGAIVE